MIFLRHKNKITTKALAHKLELKQEEYDEIEQGNHPLSDETAIRLAKLYQIDRRYFIISSSQEDVNVNLAQLFIQLQTLDTETVDLDELIVGNIAKIAEISLEIQRVNLKKIHKIRKAITDYSRIHEQNKSLLKNMEG